MKRPLHARAATLAATIAATLMLAAGALADDPGSQPAGVDEMRAFARALVHDGLYDEAIEAYALIAETLPSDAAAHYQLAGALAFVRRYEEATRAIERAIVLEPDDVRFHELAAVAYEQLRRFERAMRATLRGAELGDIKAMYTLAHLYELGRGTARSHTQALEWLERAADGGHMSAMDEMAEVYEQGLFGQAPDAARARRWRDRLETELAR